MSLFQNLEKSFKENQEKQKRKNQFTVEFLKTSTKLNNYLKFSDEKKAFGFDFILGSPKTIIKYSDLNSFELQQDGETVTKGGLGRAIVFGVATGGAGAIVGGLTGKKHSRLINTETKIKIVTYNKEKPVYYIVFNNKKLKKNSNQYKKMMEDVDKTLGFLQNIVNQENAKVAADPSTSAADEIAKYKKLADDGVITQEEFEAKKKQLLDL